MVKIQDCTDRSNMFWGVTIDSGKKYSQTVKQAFHVSMAALDLNGKKSSENVQVMLQHDSSEFLLCTLNDKILQQSLDLNFETGEEVAFSLNGSGVVHLTGYLALSEDEFDEESLSGSDEEIPSLVDTPDNSVIVGNKRKKVSAGSTPKKMKLSTSSMLEDLASDDDDDDDEDFSDDFDDDEFSDDEGSDVDSEADDDDDEDEEDDETVGNTLSKKVKTPKLENPAQKAKTPKSEGSAQKGKENKNTPKSANKDNKSLQKGTPANKSTSDTPSTPLTAENGEASKKKKKKKRKNKNTDTSLNESAASTLSQTPKSETNKKQVVAGGTIVEDLKVGHGPEAKPGKMVSVYYVGTLAKNHKQFDSCQGGKPFRFRLNQGEVIKGWDNGVKGMKVGGKRKITVPANQGYGNVKQGPIPPNSTLVFEVELKAVN
ncbi:sphingomyelin phosphodiesterase [Plakobranchus ocellatus]|uniref:FK506-binding protein n=1 Tax=Plakobranchus ocellatus TaxID=259542 RepID=A0AAV3YI25_9GAST|nr:sphingomyelin phosphodiesterase [Plakobranchus ocellatus]